MGSCGWILDFKSGVTTCLLSVTCRPPQDGDGVLSKEELQSVAWLLNIWSFYFHDFSMIFGVVLIFRWWWFPNILLNFHPENWEDEPILTNTFKGGRFAEMGWGMEGGYEHHITNFMTWWLKLYWRARQIWLFFSIPTVCLESLLFRLIKSVFFNFWRNILVRSDQPYEINMLLSKFWAHFCLLSLLKLWEDGFNYYHLFSLSRPKLCGRVLAREHTNLDLPDNSEICESFYRLPRYDLFNIRKMQPTFEKLILSF